MPYLIDGYNLLHALGILHGRTGPHGLEKARRALLGLLHGALGAQAAEATIVFDAAHAPPGAAAEEEFHGIRVVFAVRHADADEQIEEMIRRHADPRRLQVVSDDHRVRQAALRRHCVAVGCLDFVESLKRERRAARPAPAPEKSESISAAETEEWLRAFGDPAADPEFRDLFGPY